MKKLRLHPFFCVFSLLVVATVSHAQTDQSLVYATYFGGSDEELVRGGLDTRPNQWLFGSCTFSDNMPVNSNSFQLANAGGIDGFFGIFSEESGELEYGSYFGGSGNDLIKSAVFLPNSSGFVIAGHTYSDDFPVTPDAHQTEYQGDADGFIARFSESGQMLWSTYFGGSDQETLLDMAVDSSDFIYITGYTQSSGLATEGTHQTTMEGRSGFLTKFDSTGTLVWSTYFGGPVTEMFYGLALSPDGNTVYCVGSTYSGEDIAYNGWQGTYGGLEDGMIVAFNTNEGTVQWSSYYGGGKADFLSKIVVAEDGSIYTAGVTLSYEGIVSPGAHQQYYFGSGEVFLVRFAPDGSRVWATYYGGTGDDGISGLTLQNDDILLSGSTFSTNNIIFGNPMDSEGPDEDEIFYSTSYMAKFSPEGQIIWGTYFLSNRPASVYRVQALPGGAKWVGIGLILYGIDMSDIITPDAYQSTYGGGVSDLMFFVFEDNTLSTTNHERHPLEVYPNPAGHTLIVRRPESITGQLHLEMIDMTGKTVMSESMDTEGVEMNVAKLPANLPAENSNGRYSVWSEGGEGITTGHWGKVCFLARLNHLAFNKH